MYLLESGQLPRWRADGTGCMFAGAIGGTAAAFLWKHPEALWGAEILRRHRESLLATVDVPLHSPSRIVSIDLYDPVGLTLHYGISQVSVTLAVGRALFLVMSGLVSHYWPRAEVEPLPTRQVLLQLMLMVSCYITKDMLLDSLVLVDARLLTTCNVCFMDRWASGWLCKTSKVDQAV